MFSTQNLGVACGLDLSRINPFASVFDQKVEMANQAVRKWMKDPNNRAYLDSKKADYIHEKGWSIGKGLKHECDLPPEAFILLPTEIRNNKRELMKWARKNHPYLFHDQIT